MIHCLELLASFIEVLKDDCSQYISPEKCLHFLQEYLEEKDLELRQAAIYFAQKTADSCPSLLEGSIEKIAEPLIKNLTYIPNEINKPPTEAYSGCCEAAIYAVQEFARAYQEQFQKYIPICAEKISQILTGSKRLDILFGRNLAFTMVKLGHINPDTVAPYLASFLKRYCTYASNIPDEEYNEEIEEDFKIILQIMLKNLEVTVKNVVYVCTFLAKFKSESKELNQLGSQVLHEIIQIQGDQWHKFYENLPKDLQKDLKEKFLN